MLLKKTVFFLALCFALPLFVCAFDGDSVYETFAPDGIPFCVADDDWNPDGLGNHPIAVKAKRGWLLLLE